jgi:molybdate transport repressor ModE-like protein
MEDRLGVKLIVRQTGGKNGGGAILTDDARAFLKKFETLETGIRDIVDAKFKTLFLGGPHV